MPKPTKRTWINPRTGETSEAWVVSYADRSGKRRRKQFSREQGGKRAADEFAKTVTSAVRAGEFVPNSVTVSVAADRWLEACERGRNGREPVEPHTIRVYRQFARLHIKPFLGDVLLTDLTAGRVKEFRDKDLLGGGRSRAMTKKVLTALSSICREAVTDELLGVNPCVGVQIVTSARHRKRIEIPDKAAVQALVRRAQEWTAAAGRLDVGGAQMSVRPYITVPRALWFYTLLRFIVSTGVRLSEARGAAMAGLNLDRQTFEVLQRADERNRIGPVKSGAGRRVLELSDGLCADLEAWLRVAPGKTLLFGNSGDRPEAAQIIYRRFWMPLLVELGFAAKEPGPNGKRETQFGVHDLRHFHASLMIERGMQPKPLQEHMGHSSITMTMDVYGHLFTDETARAQRRKLIVAADDDLLGYPLLDGGAT